MVDWPKGISEVSLCKQCIRLQTQLTPLICPFNVFPRSISQRYSYYDPENSFGFFRIVGDNRVSPQLGSII